eukprot:1318516-Amphidinium_carterae.2
MDLGIALLIDVASSLIVGVPVSQVISRSILVPRSELSSTLWSGLLVCQVLARWPSVRLDAYWIPALTTCTISA